LTLNPKILGSSPRQLKKLRFFFTDWSGKLKIHSVNLDYQTSEITKLYRNFYGLFGWAESGSFFRCFGEKKLLCSLRCIFWLTISFRLGLCLWTLDSTFLYVILFPFTGLKNMKNIEIWCQTMIQRFLSRLPLSYRYRYRYRYKHKPSDIGRPCLQAIPTKKVNTSINQQTKPFQPLSKTYENKKKNRPESFLGQGFDLILYWRQWNAIIYTFSDIFEGWTRLCSKLNRD
jgi:hypothetical protein